MGEILGIGIEELVFIGILLALLFGPESIPKIARNAGKALNRLFRSPLYREGQQIRKQIQDLPSALARLAELEEVQKSLNSEISDLKAQMDPGLDKVSESIASVVKQQAQPAATVAKPASPSAPPADTAMPPANTIAPPTTPPHSIDDPPSHDAD